VTDEQRKNVVEFLPPATGQALVPARPETSIKPRSFTRRLLGLEPTADDLIVRAHQQEELHGIDGRIITQRVINANLPHVTQTKINMELETLRRENELAEAEHKAKLAGAAASGSTLVAKEIDLQAEAAWRAEEARKDLQHRRDMERMRLEAEIRRSAPKEPARPDMDALQNAISNLREEFLKRGTATQDLKAYRDASVALEVACAAAKFDYKKAEAIAQKPAE
jgi:hypothetical protein